MSSSVTSVKPRLHSLLMACALLLSQMASGQAFDSSFIALEQQRAIDSPDTQVNLSINAPIETVFNTLLHQVDRFSDDVARIEFDHQFSQRPGNLAIGSVRISHMEDGKTLIQRIIAFEPPYSFAYFTDLEASTVEVPLAYTVGHYQLASLTAQQTTAQISVAYKPSSRLTGFVVRRVFNRAVNKDFKRAEALLNAGNGTSP